MNLIKCPHCGKEISEEARSCVHCGYPLNSSIFHLYLGFDGHIFRIIIAIGIIVAFRDYREGLAIIAFGTLFLLIRSLR